MLQAYLPQRYQAATAHVVDSLGNFSDQIDVVVFDRQYSPFIFKYQGQTIVPAESVYAAFEAKQSANATQIRYAQDKVATVRRLHRTSLPIPHAGGVFPAKALIPILGGIADLRERLDSTPRAATGENAEQRQRRADGSILAASLRTATSLTTRWRNAMSSRPREGRRRLSCST